jgi:hypothetical protein
MHSETSTKNALMMAIAVTLAGCGSSGGHDPATGTALDGSEGQLPDLHVIQRARFAHPYGCPSGGTPSFEGTALFLSAYARQRNSPDLLYNGACGSPAYLEAATAGDDFALIADLGAVPLDGMTALMALRHKHGFRETAPVIVGHTYVVLISKSDIRALFVLRVEEQVADGPMTISYAVKSYSVQETAASSPGFDWGAPSSAASPSKGSAAVQGSVRVASGVACGSGPTNDCRGLLYVGVIDRPLALPQSTLLGSTVIPVADLGAGRSVSYSIAGLPAGSAYIAAMLVEVGVPGNPPYPKPGDLALAPAPILLQAGATSSVDLTLGSRWK